MFSKYNTLFLYYVVMDIMYVYLTFLVTLNDDILTVQLGREKIFWHNFDTNNKKKSKYFYAKHNTPLVYGIIRFP